MRLNHRWQRILVAGSLLVSLALTFSCGGGGGGGGQGQANQGVQAANWDDLEWDEGTWE